MGYADLEREWRKLDEENIGTAPRLKFPKWLQTTRNPLFSIRAAPIVEDDDAASSHGSQGGKKTKKAKPLHRPAPGLFPGMIKADSWFEFKPEWNDRWAKDESDQNHAWRGCDRKKTKFS